MADHDPLTGLLNRRALRARARAPRRARRAATARAARAMLLDIDHFKNVNDTLGHSAGDQLIGKVADALRERLRDRDAIARLGGDEFAVLLPDGDAGRGRRRRRRPARADPRAAHRRARPAGCARSAPASASRRSTSDAR